MKTYFSNDFDLIAALKKGNTNGYSFLVNFYHKKLCVYAYSLTNDRDLAEDIVQNVFMSIWNNRFKLKEDFVVKSYLYKSVYNEFIDQYRKNKEVLKLDKKYIDALAEVVEEEDEISLNKLVTIVKREIENLPPKCKQIFLLSKEEGLTNVEIAEYLNVSIKSVEAHITKAFAILRSAIGNKIDGVLFLLFGKKGVVNSF
ncbi:MAG: RNA polymerase sigma-70 factor [Flavobacteriia bacterium]|nr:RNA polymerase sigma-70 factor [Flavobacteriia bacterium]OIP48236.1 MAG: RNA polymerase sigma-70 factor [Flavobacteriaceae bacterium CG2_30_31_66]PIV96646.1 MAG: RNA polymerase sigma-70 factor [Flavobacteriaceae bacterium CG17_big_fil_post_rev_8_21_14_2_50_31_13]PIX15272.1 MAG: RNA polymerase sigma-70 factor [Flavobacteriaceae bacterium CG_4_8_14_3_um_filter_31_8]PIY14447.1 MAG: RNA polymerase sigma-70 factor [Flavobacteriaceae bacterium CG_4_10_14_3_um_filter_31_253]PIZ10034.1 MAG: RNA pol